MVCNSKDNLVCEARHDELRLNYWGFIVFVIVDCRP